MSTECSDLNLSESFGWVFNRLKCHDHLLWEYLHKLVNDPLAQATLAIGYASGIFIKDLGKSQDYGSQCFSWVLSRNDKNSLFCLGMFFDLGITVGADEIEATKYWRLGAEAGSELAQNCLGTVEEGAAKPYWYQLAAEAGYCVAQHNLGFCYCHGDGIGMDEEKGISLFQEAAAQGYRDAQCYLGIYYYQGTGLSNKDLIEAMRWFLLSASQGCDDAQDWVGCCYENGDGVGKNVDEAVGWYILAAEQNNAYAQAHLGHFYERGIGGLNKDVDIAISLYTRSVEQGCVLARKRLFKLRSRRHDGMPNIAALTI